MSNVIRDCNNIRRRWFQECTRSWVVISVDTNTVSEDVSVLVES